MRTFLFSSPNVDMGAVSCVVFNTKPNAAISGFHADWLTGVTPKFANCCLVSFKASSPQPIKRCITCLVEILEHWLCSLCGSRKIFSRFPGTHQHLDALRRNGQWHGDRRCAATGHDVEAERGHAEGIERLCDVFARRQGRAGVAQVCLEPAGRIAAGYSHRSGGKTRGVGGVESGIRLPIAHICHASSKLLIFCR